MQLDKTKNLEDLYREGVAHTLGGFQLIEAGLKDYISTYYESVRETLKGKLHFGFQYSEIQDAPLGKLITLFSKTCANEELVAELRSMIKHRDNAAHRAFVCLYGKRPTHTEFIKMIDENINLQEQVQVILNRINAEWVNVSQVLHQQKKQAAE